MTTTAANAQASPILTALRAATHDSHKAVERLTPFFRADFDRTAYLRWLDAMHGFYRVLDAAVAASGFVTHTGWQYLERSALIGRDLAALAERAPAAPLDPHGVLAPLAGMRSIGEVGGMLYVVEGSALGGKVLLKVLERGAAVTADAGAGFFAPHGEQPHLRWSEYVALLERLALSATFQQDAVAGAEATFNALLNWVTEVWRD
jgi:heme oxygenase